MKIQHVTQHQQVQQPPEHFPDFNLNPGKVPE